jgi:hypothetical protein
MTDMGGMGAQLVGRPVTGFSESQPSFCAAVSTTA